MRTHAFALSLTMLAAAGLPTPAEAHARVHVDIVRIAPPQPRRTLVPPPRPDRVWVAGHWVWSPKHKAWRWIEGRWIRR